MEGEGRTVMDKRYDSDSNDNEVYSDDCCALEGRMSTKCKEFSSALGINIIGPFPFALGIRKKGGTKASVLFHTVSSRAIILHYSVTVKGT